MAATSRSYVRRVFHPTDRCSIFIELDHQAAANLIERYEGMQES